MIKDFRGNEIKVGSKIVYPTYSRHSRPVRIYMNEGEVVDIIEEDFGWRDKCHALKVRKDTSGKVVKILALNRVVVIPDENLSGFIPSVFDVGEGFTPPEFTVTYETLPVVTGKLMTDEEKKETLVSSAEALVEEMTPLQKRQLMRTLLRKTINLGLGDVE